MPNTFLQKRIKTKDNKLILAIYVISVSYIVFTPFVKSFSYVDELSTLFLGGYILQYFGKFLPINKNKTIESVLAGSKLH